MANFFSNSFMSNPAAQAAGYSQTGNPYQSYSYDPMIGGFAPTAQFAQKQQQRGLEGLQAMSQKLQLEGQLREQQANLPFSQKQSDIERQKLSIAQQRFNPSEYNAGLQRQEAYDKAKMDYEMKQIQFRNQALDWKKQMMGRFGFGGSPSSNVGGYGSREYSPQSALAPTPMASSRPSWMNSYSTPKFPSV